ncbi:MAG: ribonuclease P protein component [Rhodospirillales bacterium]|nr:ribonuclease P protein component [Rhodospirillales bacterium]
MALSIPRLKRRTEFLKVAGARHKWVAPGLILQARRQTPGNPLQESACPFRVGYTVSRKVGNAVKRNRAKRRLRSAVTAVLPDHAKEGFDFVIIGRAATLRRTFPALLNDLETALKKLDAYR